MGVFGVGMVGTLHGVTLMMRVRFFFHLPYSHVPLAWRSPDGR